MKKIIKIIGILGIGLILLAGCGKTSDTKICEIRDAVIEANYSSGCSYVDSIIVQDENLWKGAKEYVYSTPDGNYMTLTVIDINECIKNDYIPEGVDINSDYVVVVKAPVYQMYEKNKDGKYNEIVYVVSNECEESKYSVDITKNELRIELIDEMHTYD